MCTSALSIQIALWIGFSYSKVLSISLLLDDSLQAERDASVCFAADA